MDSVPKYWIIKGAYSCGKYFLPPPATLDGDLWKPARKLVALQKGSNDRETFVCNVLQKEEEISKCLRKRPICLTLMAVKYK